jgi:hypothetical protein
MAMSSGKQRLKTFIISSVMPALCGHPAFLANNVFSAFQTPAQGGGDNILLGIPIYYEI